MTDREPSAGKPSGSPAPWAVKAAKAGAAPTAPAGTASPPATGVAPAPDGAEGPRRRFAPAAWAVLGVLLVGAGAVVGIVLGSQEDPIPAAGGSSSTVEGDAVFGAPELPSADDEPTRVEPSTPATPSGPTAPAPQPVAGDLGLSVPISSPVCDGTWVVFLGAATDAAAYTADVSELLDTRPGAMYTLTRGGCSSMRQQLDDGSLIYAVYTGPYPDQAAACSARDAIGGGAYVKRMDDVTPAEQLWEC